MTTPLVLLPGMMCDARMFAPQVAALSGTREVIVGDLSVAETMTGLARAVLDRAPDRFALAGLSMGGIVAMEMLRLAPERIARLALLDTNPLAEADELKARRAVQMARVEKGELRAIMRDEMKPNYLADGPNRTEILTLCMDMAEALGPDVFLAQSRALRDRRDQCETLRSFDGPALVLCGRDDVPCPISRHDLMHELLPDSDLVIVEGAGHLPVLEQPDATNRALVSWLDRDDRQRPPTVD